MYRKSVISMVLCLSCILICYGAVNGKDVHSEQDDSVSCRTKVQAGRIMGVVDVAVSGERIVECKSLKVPDNYDTNDRILINSEDYEMLLRIVEAEAGGEDQTGKLLVANVVLNRVADEDFPDSVTEVVLQSSGGVTQFSPVSTGRIWKTEISTDTVEAVERALGGEDLSEGALFFAARKYADSKNMRWFDENLTFLFRYGGHEFYM